MSLTFEDINENLRRIALFGRLDVPGTEAVADEFARLVAAAPKHVIVDLSSVSFVGSVAVRILISGAKELQRRGCKLLLVLGDSVVVRRSIEAMGIDELIPTFESVAEAGEAALD